MTWFASGRPFAPGCDSPVPHDPRHDIGTGVDDVRDSPALTEAKPTRVDCALGHTAHSDYDWGWVVERARLVLVMHKVV